MKIYKYFHYLIIILLISMTACEKYTDITPKGKNLLNRAEDLNLLMNVNYRGSAFDMLKQSLLINDMYPHLGNVPTLISSGIKNMDYTLLTYDPTVDRAGLTASDGAYEGMYNYISTVANIVLTNVEKASGDPKLLGQLKSEALVLRAYMHYILVNIYAKAYDPSTAATDGGIPYVDDINFESVNAKRTIGEVYSLIVSDLESAITSGALPDKPINSMRIGKGFAYAVKSRVQLTLRDYKGAYLSAVEGLKYNSTLEDHRPFLPVNLGGTGEELFRIGTTASDNLLYAYYGQAAPSTFSPTYEILNDYYETGNIIKDYTTTYNYPAGLASSGLEGIPLWDAFYMQNAAGLTTSDLYLVKAEALIRDNKINEGMEVVNYVRERRIYPYAPLTTSSQEQAMKYLQKTSRIEFLYTWRNFSDVKRWVKEGQFPISISRTILGKTYNLSKESPLWVFPFPQSATNFNPTLSQNY